MPLLTSLKLSFIISLVVLHSSILVVVLFCVLLILFFLFSPRFVKKEEESTAPSSCVYWTMSRLIWEDSLDIWRWWRNEDFLLLFFSSVTGASNDMVVKQFKYWYLYISYFFNTNLLSESVLIWKKNGLNLILTVGCSSDGILFLLPQFLSYVLLKENIFTLNSIEN